jgi:hypothetical protein
MAEEKTLTFDKVLNRELTEEEYSQRVATLAQELFEGAARPKQISPAFDAPQFANDWIAVGTRSGFIRAPKVMRRGERIDKHGLPVINRKTGEKVITWIPYAA